MRLMARLARRWVDAARVRRWRGGAGDLGMSTAEYAVGMVAAVAFAGVLLKIATSQEVTNLLLTLIKRALRWDE